MGVVGLFVTVALLTVGCSSPSNAQFRDEYHPAQYTSDVGAPADRTTRLRRPPCGDVGCRSRNRVVRLGRVVRGHRRRRGGLLVPGDDVVGPGDPRARSGRRGGDLGVLRQPDALRRHPHGRVRGGHGVGPVVVGSHRPCRGLPTSGPSGAHPPGTVRLSTPKGTPSHSTTGSGGRRVATGDRCRGSPVSPPPSASRSRVGSPSGTARRGRNPTVTPPRDRSQR